MIVEAASHPPADKAPKMSSLSGPFSFQFTAPPKIEEAVRRTITREPTMQGLDTMLPWDEESKPAPIQRLPAEIHTLIAHYLTLPSRIMYLAWTCRRLYASLGPTNRLMWHNILHRRTQEIPNAVVPAFSPEENYYQICLDRMCNRTPKSGCQRCLLHEDSMYTCTNGSKNDEKWTQLVDIYVAKIYRGTWCWECTKEVYESVAIVKLVTPIPEVPPTLFTEIRQHPCGHLKPGLFVSRTAIAAAIKEQCPNGGYSPFNIEQHAEPDIREAKPYIMKTIIGLYTRGYKHLHILFPPKELGKNIKQCLEIKKLNMSAPTIQNELVDAVFGVARKYLSSKELENEEEQSKERFEACEKFLLMFFGMPNILDSGTFKMPVPTTRFLAFISKRYWLTRMEEMGRDISKEPAGGKVKYCVDDKPRKRCGICVGKCEKNPDGVTDTYSPVLMVCHMISDHPDQIKDDWPEVPDLKVVKKGKLKAAGLSRKISKSFSGYDEESVGDVRLLFDADAELEKEVEAGEVAEAPREADELEKSEKSEAVEAVEKVEKVETAETEEFILDTVKNLFISSESSESETTPGEENIQRPQAAEEIQIN